MSAMATLHLRDVPADLDAVLRRDAADRGISKNRLAIDLLRRAVGLDQIARAALVAEIRRDRRRVDVDVAGLIRGERPDDGR
jgi:hypothetical protein